jgi:hypothetical protein
MIETKSAYLKALERRVLWLASWTIHQTNHVREADGIKIGGHQASSASMAAIMTALYFHVLRPEDRVAVKPHASPIFHAIQYLAGNQTLEHLQNFRAYKGAQSYPSRTKRYRRCRLLNRFGWHRGSTNSVFLTGPRLRQGAWLDETSPGRPYGGAHWRRRNGRGKHPRGVDRGVETEASQLLVDCRLQSSVA